MEEEERESQFADNRTRRQVGGYPSPIKNLQFQKLKPKSREIENVVVNSTARAT
jgi:hypothetical protein